MAANGTNFLSRIELERHEIAATWTIQEYERRKLLTDDPDELTQLDQQIAENQRLLRDVQIDLSQLGHVLTGEIL